MMSMNIIPDSEIDAQCLSLFNDKIEYRNQALNESCMTEYKQTFNLFIDSLRILKQ